MHARSSTRYVCQQHASPSSNMLHCCCARCFAPSCCTTQRQHPASTARSASCWRDDSSTILVDEPTRQQCADHVLAAEAAATLSRRGGTIKRPQNGPFRGATSASEQLGALCFAKGTPTRWASVGPTHLYAATYSSTCCSRDGWRGGGDGRQRWLFNHVLHFFANGRKNMAPQG